MTAQEYVDRLNRLYEVCYGCGETHTCAHWNECRLLEKGDPAPTDTVKFYYDRVKVGEAYDTLYPRVLFCGLEGGHSGKENYRIPPICLDRESSKPSCDAINNHYRGVRYTLSYLLSALMGQTPPQNACKAELDKAEYKEHLRHYCLTNLYKCGFAFKKSGLPHSQVMKDECYKIFLEEIAALRPQFVVIQAVSDVPSGLWRDLQARYGGKQATLIARAARNDNTSAYRLQYDDGSPLYCLWTYHGNGFPFPKRKGGVFPNNTAYLREELNPVLEAVAQHFKEAQSCRENEILA